MRKLVVLKLDGDLEQGVWVTLTIEQEDNRPSTEITGNLPPNPDIATAIEQWRSNYRSLDRSDRIKALKILSQWRQDCNSSASELRSHLNRWLLSESFRSIRDKCLQQFIPPHEVRVLIRTSSQMLLKLPWHLWDLIDQNSLAEVALSAPDSESRALEKTPTLRGKIKILAILGNSFGIDVQKDRQVLENLPDAETTFLVEPQRREINDQLWEQPWDILFFAGHSSTEGASGRIYINQTDSLTIEELRYALRNAVNNGLHLAIFNSCDGMGLAFELQQLQIPQIIVMREPVPDKVAQAFVTYFLPAFADGRSLYLVEREAREKLQGLENEFPCASWLPVIFQNPATVPLAWQELGRRPTDKCPYRGLFAFQQEDAPFFFGRDKFIDDLVMAVQKQGLVTVIGPSGTGKSSVVFAGLIPRLRSSGSWRIVCFRPSDRPFHALVAALGTQNKPQMNLADQHLEIIQLADNLRQLDNALRSLVEEMIGSDPGTHLLLVADQFEELYTLCQDTQQRQDFLDRLLEATNLVNFTLVLTLRADFLGQALSYRPIADALQYRDLKLGPMNREELQRAVEQPASLFGVILESGLTERILNVVSAEPGYLPMLEFALTQLWEKQSQGQMTHNAYEKIGGVEKALAGYAQEAYNRLSNTDKKLAQRVFIQLVQPGEGTEDTRRRSTRAEVGEDNWDLVRRLADARLVVTGRNEVSKEETVEIVHEALIREWGHLRDWMEADRQFRIWQERLRYSLRQWQTNSEHKDRLLHGFSLDEAKNWLQQRLANLSKDERRYIRLSLEQKEKEQAERQREQAERERLSRRFINWLIIGIIIALSLTVLASAQWWRAQQERQNIFAHSLIDEAELTRSQPELLQLSVALGIEAIKQSPSVELKPFLYDDLALLPHFRSNLLDEHSASVNAVAFSSKGKYLATAGLANSQSNSIDSEGYTCVWEVASNKHPSCVIHKNNVNAVAFSPDEKHLVIASSEGKPRLCDLQGKKLPCRNLEGGTNAIVFSPNGKYLATAGADGKVWVLTTQDYKLLGKPLQLKHGFPVIAIAFSPDNKSLVTASLNGEVYVWDLTSGNRPRILVNKDSHENSVNAVAFSPKNGKYLATASSDGTVLVWDLTTDKSIKHIDHDNVVVDVAFSPDGLNLVTASLDGTARLWRDWNSKSDKEIVKLTHNGPVTSVTFSSDGKYVATASSDKTARVWEVTSGNEFARMIHKDGVNAIAFSPDSLVATASLDGTARIWDIKSPRTATLMKHKAKVNSMALSLSGKYLATASSDKIVRVWNATSNYQKFLTPPQNKPVTVVNFSPQYKDEKEYLATVSSDNKVMLWDANNGNQVLPPQSPLSLEKVSSIAFSPQEKYLATANPFDRYAKLWKIPTGTPVVEKTTMYHEQYITSVAFSPDGKYLVTASRDRTAHVWKVSSGELLTRVQHDAFVEAVAFSKDGKLLATASRDGKVKVSQISIDEKSKLLVELPPESPVTSLTFSPNKYLAVASGDNTVKVWDINNKERQKPVATMPHNGSVTSISFSPDGQYLATASKDNTVRIWQITNDKMLIETILYGEPVTAVSFSPDGKYLAATSGDSTARVLLWQRQELIKNVCDQLTYNLTSEEWHQYHLDDNNVSYHKTCKQLP